MGGHGLAKGAAGEQVTNPVNCDRAARGPDQLKFQRELRRRHQESVAERREHWIRAHSYFYDRLKRLLRFIVEPGKRVLELGCETGHLLASVEPSYGVGVESSEAMLAVAGRKYSGLRFVSCDVQDVELNETFVSFGKHA